MGYTILLMVTIYGAIYATGRGGAHKKTGLRLVAAPFWCKAVDALCGRGLSDDNFFNLVALTADEQATLRVGNAYALEVVELNGSVGSFGSYVSDTGFKGVGPCEVPD